jgi:hypothetical protein
VKVDNDVVSTVYARPRMSVPVTVSESDPAVETGSEAGMTGTIAAETVLPDRSGKAIGANNDTSSIAGSGTVVAGADVMFDGFAEF